MRKYGTSIGQLYQTFDYEQQQSTIANPQIQGFAVLLCTFLTFIILFFWKVGRISLCSCIYKIHQQTSPIIDLFLAVIKPKNDLETFMASLCQLTPPRLSQDTIPKPLHYTAALRIRPGPFIYYVSKKNWVGRYRKWQFFLTCNSNSFQFITWAYINNVTM